MWPVEHTHTHIYMYTHAHTDTCMHTCTHIHTCTSTYFQLFNCLVYIFRSGLFARLRDGSYELRVKDTWPYIGCPPLLQLLFKLLLFFFILPVLRDEKGGATWSCIRWLRDLQRQTSSSKFLSPWIPCQHNCVYTYTNHGHTHHNHTTPMTAPTLTHPWPHPP